MKNYQAVIYDIDGTILNTLDMNMYPLLQIIKEELGEVWSFEEVLHFAHYPGMKVMEELQVANPVATYQRWVDYVNQYPTGASLFTGMETVFEEFAKGKVRQAVVSAKNYQQYEIDMVEKGLAQYMEIAVLAEDTTKHKPDPEPLLLCLKQLELKPEEAIYIGDALSDSQAAQAVGMDFGFAKWGSLLTEVPENNFIFDEPKDLLLLMKS